MEKFQIPPGKVYFSGTNQTPKVKIDRILFIILGGGVHQSFISVKITALFYDNPGKASRSIRTEKNPGMAFNMGHTLQYEF